jgi:hypothetical protein
MSDLVQSSLVLRFRRSDPAAAGSYTVEAMLNDASSVRATIKLAVDDLRTLEPGQWDYGRYIGERVFADVNLRSAMAFARGTGNGHVSVSIEIDPEAPELYDILWERIILAGGDQEIAPAADSHFALARRIVSEEPAQKPGEGVFRLLAVISSPVELEGASEDGSLPAIQVPKEIGSLRLAWDNLVQRGQMRVRVLARMPEALQADLRQAGYEVAAQAASLDAVSDALSGFDSLHLICHGSFRKGSAALLMEDPDGHQAIVGEDQFLPRLGSQRLRLVFLHACKSAQRQAGSANVLSGLAPKIARRAAAVVAMQDYVRIEDASRFAREFYSSLLATGSAAAGANAGRLVLFRPGSVDWAIPAVFQTPQSDPVWVPDSILAASQDLALRLREKPEVASPFPIEVVRQAKDTPANMENSPPGPRMRVSQAVASLLAPAGGTRSSTIVLAGNYGRGKTAQLCNLFVEHAAKVSAGGPLPLLCRAADFEVSDATPAEIVARAIARTYKRELDAPLPVAALQARLTHDFVLFVEASENIDRPRRIGALKAAAALVGGHSSASVVVTLDVDGIADAAALESDDGSPPAILLVQLMSEANVEQYLQSLPKETGARLLDSIRSNNLYDLASVPWLLSCLLKQTLRAVLSRSAVIARVVAANLMSVDWPAGVRRMVSDALGRIAWTMQTDQSDWISGNRLYEILDAVRDRREIPLDSLRDAALQTSLLCPYDDDSVRFAYPGFQSYWCAQHLIAQGPQLESFLDDITATLGKRSRIALWQDTLVLLAGLLEQPDLLLRRIVTGSSLGRGSPLVLVAACIQEARLNGRTVSSEVTDHVLDSLIWCSTAAKERNPAARVEAIQCLGLLHEKASVPHLFALAFDRVPIAGHAEAGFEFSGIRQAAVRVLLTMEEDALAYLKEVLNRPGHNPSLAAIPALAAAWRTADSKSLQEIFRTSGDGIPAIAAFGLGALGSGNLEFLAAELRRPETVADTAWAIAEALLPLNPLEVTRLAIRPIYDRPDLRALAAFMIGKLRIATPGDDEYKFLCGLLQSKFAKDQGTALRALAEMGDTSWRVLCECLATGDWDGVCKELISLPDSPAGRATLRFYALDALRLIGTLESADRLRLARHSSEGVWPDDFMSMSYEVSEDIFRRCARRPNAAN